MEWKGLSVSNLTNGGASSESSLGDNGFLGSMVTPMPSG